MELLYVIALDKEVTYGTELFFLYNIIYAFTKGFTGLVLADVA